MKIIWKQHVATLNWQYTILAFGREKLCVFIILDLKGYTEYHEIIFRFLSMQCRTTHFLGFSIIIFCFRSFTFYSFKKLKSQISRIEASREMSENVLLFFKEHWIQLYLFLLNLPNIRMCNSRTVIAVFQCFHYRFNNFIWPQCCWFDDGEFKFSKIRGESCVEWRKWKLW